MTYDYSLRAGKSVLEMRANYTQMMKQLKEYFRTNYFQNAEESLQELGLLIMLQEEITPKLFLGPQSGVCPAIEIKDASI